MAVKAEEEEEEERRRAEKYLREVMGIVEDKEQQRRTRRKEAEQEGGTRRKDAEEGGQTRRRQEAKAKKKMKVEKVLVEEEELVECQQGPLIVTKAFFILSLCLFLTSSALLLSDYKQKDSLALRQTVANLPSFETPAMFAKLPPLTSIANTAREAFVQIGWLGEDSWEAAKLGLLKVWERTEVVAANGIQLGSRLAEAIYRKVLVPALQWLQEPRRRGGPSHHQPQHQQHHQHQQHQQQHQQHQQHQQKQQEVPERKKEGAEKTGFPRPSASAGGGPSRSDMEAQLARKIAATTAYLNKEREHTEDIERKQVEMKRTKKEEKLVKKVEKEKEESSMEDFKRLQARRREAEGKR